MQLLGQPEWTGLEEDLTELMQVCESNGSEDTAYYSALLQYYTKVNSEACPCNTPNLAIPCTLAAFMKAHISIS